MSRFSKHPSRDLSFSLLGPDYLPIGEAEVALRDAAGPPRRYRYLKSGEIDLLNQYGNYSPDWGSVQVTDPFHPHFVRRCRFYGMVRLGGFENLIVSADELRLPVGLYDSMIVSSDLGKNVALHRVGYLAHAIVADEAVLFNVGSVSTTLSATFGNGGLRGDGNRLRIDVANENGGRAILPFAGILPADAWLMSRHRDDSALCEQLQKLTDAAFDPQPGQYSQIRERAVVRESAALQDVIVGAGARITGAARVQNVTVLSDETEPATIADGAVVLNGIVGFGAHVGAGVKARNFVLGTRARLEDGARCFHTFLGDNSTIACCEVLGNLVFPFHEQHHNNSFMIATTVLGQSNIAAGVTLGSNHNSRSPDGEVLAGRGFWPGLCTDFKHNCRFASWTLLAKGSYPAEINLSLPFSLVAQTAEGLHVTPAWWFLHNMFALERSRWKFRDRDRRVHAGQHIETDPLAPDTVEEIMVALERLESWAGRAVLAREGSLVGPDIADEAAQARGRELMEAGPIAFAELDVLVDGIENSRRPTRIRKSAEAWAIYREMIHHYAVSTLMKQLDRSQSTVFGSLAGMFQMPRERRWVNAGGQLVAGEDYDLLRRTIVSGALSSWQSVHAEYDRLWSEYPAARARHAAAVLLAIEGIAPEQADAARWRDWLTRAAAAQRKIAGLVGASLARDYANPFRSITFDNRTEMEAVVGNLDANKFILQVEKETADFCGRVDALLKA